MPSPTPPKINLEDVSINKAQVELQRAITQLEMAKKKKDADFQMHVAARQSSDRQPSAHRVQVKGGSPAVTPDMEEPTVSKPTPNSKTAGGKEKERRLDSEGSEEAGQVEEELMELKLPLSSKTVGRKGKERELDDSEEEGESKKSGEEEEEGSDGEKDGEDDDETDGEDEEEVDELEGEEPVKSQGAPPAQKESGKGLSKQKVVPAMGGSSKESDPKGMTADGDTCARCVAARTECVRPAKGGTSCVRCKGMKKKCETVTDDTITRKADKREIAPLRKRGYKRKAIFAATGPAPAFGVLRQATPPESPPAESTNDAVIVVKPLLPRAAAPPPLRPLKRKRLEEAERNQPTTRTPSEYSERSLVTQRQNAAFVEIQKSQASSSRTHVHLLTGDLPPALETRLLNIEQMQITLNERLTSTLGAVERMEDLLRGWMASYNGDKYGGDDDEDTGDEE